MRLISAKIDGVASYFDVQRINFSTLSAKPITVIHGENGAGKTSTLNAILWCLTGQLSPGFSRQIDKDGFHFLHRERSEVGAPAFVEVTFEHEGQEYVARRELADTRLTADRLGGEFNLSVKQNGTLSTFTTTSKSTMAKILPPGIARYFIFDGEGFQQSTRLSDSEVRKSVRTILGFDFVDDVAHKLKRVIKEKNSEHAKRSAEYQTDANARKKFLEASEQKAQLTDDIEDKKRLLIEANEALQEVRGKIHTIGSDRVKDLQQRKQTLTQQYLSTKALQKKDDGDRISLISSYYKVVFGREIIKGSLGLIEKGQKTGEVYGPYNREFVRGLLKDMTCICGEPIDEEKKKKIEDKLTDGFTDTFQERLSNAAAISKMDLGTLGAFKKEHTDLAAALNDHEKNLRHYESELEGIEKEIEELAGLSEQLKELTNLEARLNAHVLTLEQDIESLGTRLEVANHTIKENRGAGNAIKTDLEPLVQEIETLERLVSAAQKFVESELAEAHRFILESMRKFISGTNIPHGVRLEENFSFHYVDQNEVAIFGSTGESKTLEYAFLCSLVRLVAKNSTDKGSLLLPSSSVPLIVDGPFSEIAETYVSYIARMLLEVSDQLVVLLFNKDWPALESVVREQVGAEYLLVKNIVDSNDGREAERHTFSGQEYECVQYNSRTNSTSIVEIKL